MQILAAFATKRRQQSLIPAKAKLRVSLNNTVRQKYEDSDLSIPIGLRFG